MQKEYEILYIIKPNVGDNVVQEINANVQSWITNTGGEIIVFKEIGMRDLGTEFSKNKQGFYALCQFRGDNAVLDELNQRMRVTDGILRYINIKLDSSESPAILETDPQKVSS